MIRIVFAEDQTIVRRGIVTLLQFSGEICVDGEAADGLEAVNLCLTLKPDVAVFDIRMPKLTGIQALQRLTELGCAPPTLMLTTFDEDPLFLQAVGAGAKGFLLKDISAERLVDAIRELARGGTVLQPVVTERVIQAFQEASQRKEGSDLLGLSPREKDVLRLVAAGYSNRDIGETLGMAEGTVKNNVSSVLGKLGARDRTQAVLRAIQLGHL